LNIFLKIQRNATKTPNLQNTPKTVSILIFSVRQLADGVFVIWWQKTSWTPELLLKSEIYFNSFLNLFSDA
jgi:hypothetical protein